MKPQFYILKYGSMEQLKSPQLAGAAGLHVTTGLIVYKNPSTSLGIKGGMIIDPGMVADFYEYQDKLVDFDLDLKNISHFLITHFHQDHVQALGKYPDGTHIFHYGASSILGSSEYGGKVYTDGFIEVPEIRFELIEGAHTKKDTIYIIDSENEGIVAFVGDLVFSLFDKMPKETQKGMDKSASDNPERRYQLFKEFFEKHPEIEGFYLGHYYRRVSREEIKEYLEEWNKT